VGPSYAEGAANSAGPGVRSAGSRASTLNWPSLRARCARAVGARPSQHQKSRQG
jgi:hypothetical protein